MVVSRCGAEPVLCLHFAGTLTVEQIYQDRDQFAKLVREVASPDVGRMGIEILSFTIKVWTTVTDTTSNIVTPKYFPLHANAKLAAPESVRVCVLQDVYDKVDYLSSLGKTQTAAVQRDADIGVAEAERDAGIRVRSHGCVLRLFISHQIIHSSTL